ncbi:hypothetical protein As57867_022574, partial [Aphanomyces stellatus]
MKWLTTNPVHVFSFENWILHTDVEDTTRDSFFNAMFTCPTMKVLELAMCDLSQLVVPSLAMTRLELRDVKLTPPGIVSLARALAVSSVEDICLSDNNEEPPFSSRDYILAFVELFKAVGLSKVTRLVLRRCNLNDSYWPSLGPLLQQSKLQNVKLNQNGITNDGLRHIAEAIQGNATLEEVEVGWNSITADGARHLLTCMKHRVTNLRFLWIPPLNDLISKEDRISINALAK